MKAANTISFNYFGDKITVPFLVGYEAKEAFEIACDAHLQDVGYVLKNSFGEVFAVVEL